MCVCVCVWYTHIYRTLFIYSFVDGRLDVLAVVNNAAVNVGVHISSSNMSFAVDKYPQVELLDHVVVLLLVVLETTTLLSTAAAPFTSPPAVHKGSPFSTPSRTLVTACLFENGYSDRWYLFVILMYLSLVISDVELFFMYLLVFY